MKTPISFCLISLLLTSTTIAMKLDSTVFGHNDSIPAKYTCVGDKGIKNISPPLQWSDIPPGTQSLALIMDDPDAPGGTFDHWIVFNIPPSTTGFTENLKSLPEGAKTGKNSWGKNEYGGPCPPDKEHRYIFKLYALNIILDLPAGSSKAAVLDAMKGHIKAEVELIGKYDKPKELKEKKEKFKK